MKINYAGMNLQGKSFKGINLEDADFSGADLRGADFSSANLQGANLSKVVTGLRTFPRIAIFTGALVVSLFSGYIAMQAGTTVQSMLHSADPNVRLSGYVTCGFFALFFAIGLWKGVTTIMNELFFIMIGIAVIASLFFYFSELGTGLGALQGCFALLLMAVMFIVGTISRATAGTLASTVLFLIVALGGGMFGKSIGGGIGTVLMAVSCALISKHALKPGSQPTILTRIALAIGDWFGTSFKNADLSRANFSDATISNTSFFNSNTDAVNWTNSKKQFTIESHG